jgi:shikimate dehydrogenase
MTPALNRYGLIGRSLGHSVSPVIHNQAFKILKIPAFYENIEIEPQDFDIMIREIKEDLSFSGLNVTIPYKSTIRPYLDEIDRVAGKIGAVNTITINQGRWKGYNTDIIGFREPLLRLRREFNYCLLIGSGGAARAVLYVLLEVFKPVKIQIISILPEEAKNLIDYFKNNYTYTEFVYIDAHKFNQDLILYDLIVNASPVGMHPDIGQTPLPGLNRLKDGCVVYDLVYNPLKTKLLNESEKAGKNITTIGGIEMLLLQAAEAFKLWTGKEMPLKKVRQVVLKEMGERVKGKG